MAKYAARVKVYGERGYLFTEASWYAERLIKASKAERIGKGRIEAVRLISPLNPEEGHERVSSLKRYSSLGQAHDTGMTYMMREYGSKQFAPKKAMRMLREDLVRHGAVLRPGESTDCMHPKLRKGMCG